MEFMSGVLINGTTKNTHPCHLDVVGMDVGKLLTKQKRENKVQTINTPDGEEIKAIYNSVSRVQEPITYIDL